MAGASPWLDAVDELVDACAANGRPDLAGRLRRKRARLLDPHLRVQVIGEPNQGKSELVNALVNAPVCPVGDDCGPHVTTVVHHAAAPAAVLVGGSRRLPVPVDRVGAELGAHPEVVTAEIGIPRTLLARGVVLVDSPSTEPEAGLDADVVVLAAEATRELSTAELGLLARAVKHCPEIIVALTKIDLAPRWRQLAQRGAQDLARANVPATVLGVSAALRLRAARTDDHALNAESGFTELVQRLQAMAAAKAAVLAPRAAAVLVRHAVDELSRNLAAELGAWPDGSAEPDLPTVEELRRESVRCQTMLADEMADLASDLEFDLRDRARRILREVDRTFEVADPLRHWPGFEQWLEANLADAAEAHFTWLVQRCAWIADKVAHHFPAPCEAPALPPGVGTDDFGALERPRLEPFTLGQKAFTGLRGSYGGVLMAGLVTSLAVGLPLISPISIGAGVLFGGKSIQEEGENRRRRRQAAAKAAAQRHVDDFFLRFGKDCKDASRYVQRGLRDHFAALAAELIEDAANSRRSAVAAREHRQREIRRQLEHLVALDGRVTQPRLESTA